MAPNSRHRRGLAWTATGMVVSLLAVVAVPGCGAVHGRPSVDALAADYRANREQFRVIARLAAVDATFGIDVASGRLSGHGIDEDGVPDYVETLDALRAVGAEHVSAWDHSLDITTESEGLAISGRQSGYFFTTSSEIETVPLDVARSPDAPRTWLYPLGDGWYASDYRF